MGSAEMRLAVRVPFRPLPFKTAYYKYLSHKNYRYWYKMVIAQFVEYQDRRGMGTLNPCML